MYFTHISSSRQNWRTAVAYLWTSDNLLSFDTFLFILGPYIFIHAILCSLTFSFLPINWIFLCVFDHFAWTITAVLEANLNFFQRKTIFEALFFQKSVQVSRKCHSYRYYWNWKIVYFRPTKIWIRPLRFIFGRILDNFQHQPCF